ncbi:MAG: hypothetical protein WDA59_05090 [Methanofastidiosum sp.]|jgi:hypothetical protein
MIYIINGSGGSGKDLFVQYCGHFLSVYNISSVDKIKEAAKILGWNGEKDENSRYFLAHMKYLSSRYNNHPYEYIKEQIEYFLENSDLDIMFIHIREPEEIDKVKKDFDCKTILIRNSNVKEIKSNEADANVEDYKYDIVIDNSGTLDDLKKKVFDFINMIVGDKDE